MPYQKSAIGQEQEARKERNGSGFKRLAQRFWRFLARPFRRAPQPRLDAQGEKELLGRVERALVTEGVVDTLFQDFAVHRASDRGEEEIGWLLLGHREQDHMVVEATLPAGANRDAGVAHVRFSSPEQIIASRILRQEDRRLCILGVVHTHPGSLCRPSKGDYRGDSEWVQRLRGQEGLFGIGTADGKEEAVIASDDLDSVQCRGSLLFSWYALAAGDEDYRRIPIETVGGADRAKSLQSVWPVLEEHAERLERLFAQQARLECEVVDQGEKALMVSMPLAESGDRLRLLLTEEQAQYFVVLSGEAMTVNPQAANVEEGTYLLLAELARRA